jgi:hypothetical protein
MYGMLRSTPTANDSTTNPTSIEAYIETDSGALLFESLVVAAMKAHVVPPETDTEALLAGAQFVDAYQLVMEDLLVSAPAAAQRILGHAPHWVSLLMTLRNRVVAPLGLKTPGPDAIGSSKQIGIFPLLSQTADRVILGLEDKHLDFRLIVDVSHQGTCSRVTLTTLVRTHNLLGRTYLAIILPFHRIIALAMLRQAAALHISC